MAWHQKTSQGISLNFIDGSKPLGNTPFHSTPTRFSNAGSSLLDTATRHRGHTSGGAASGTIGGLWSTFFLVAKKNMAKMRGLIHFYKLNLHLEYAHFKMEGLHIVRNLLRRRDHMAKVDMSDFFFHYPIELKAAGTFAPCGGAGSCGECKRCCPA